MTEGGRKERGENRAGGHPQTHGRKYPAPLSRIVVSSQIHTKAHKEKPPDLIGGLFKSRA